MNLRIGQIPYLNSILFYNGLRPGPGGRITISFDPLVPRRLSGAAVEGALDAGPVPLVTCWEIEHQYEPLAGAGQGNFCIATVDKAHSILLFAKRPFDDLAGARIGITAETSTSVRLLKVLLAEIDRAHGATFVPVDRESNDAFLLIGDEALVHRRGIAGYPHVVDLGEVWRARTGLPFVFARWVVRREVPAAVREELTRSIATAFEGNVREIDRVVAPRGASLGMTVSEMVEYLGAFQFTMGDAERLAVERFRELDKRVSADNTVSK